MLIVYTSPIDGLPRAKQVLSFREAAMILMALEDMGAEPSVTTISDLKTATPTALPLIINAMSPDSIRSAFEQPASPVESPT